MWLCQAIHNPCTIIIMYSYQQSCSTHVFIFSHVYVSACMWPTYLDISNHIPHRKNRLYLDLKFQCEGYITAWELRAAAAGGLYLDVYRHSDTVAGAYILVSRTLVNIPTPGLYKADLDPADYIKIHPHDVVGYHFPTSSGPDIIHEVSSSASMSGMSYTVDQLSRLYADDVYGDDLVVGSTFGPMTPHQIRAIPNIKPHVTPGKTYTFKTRI